MGLSCSYYYYYYYYYYYFWFCGFCLSVVAVTYRAVDTADGELKPRSGWSGQLFPITPLPSCRLDWELTLRAGGSALPFPFTLPPLPSYRLDGKIFCLLLTFDQNVCAFFDQSAKLKAWEPARHLYIRSHRKNSIITTKTRPAVTTVIAMAPEISSKAPKKSSQGKVSRAVGGVKKSKTNGKKKHSIYFSKVLKQIHPVHRHLEQRHVQHEQFRERNFEGTKTTGTTK